jgi:two-component system, sensor histidine kinase PdtaS
MEKRRDQVVREKAVLYQELQHRIANSLQIIASVLLQSARRVRSEQTREHLYDAHSRVMSLAAMQQQLSATREGSVEIRSYLTDLIRSIGALMIRDPNQITIAVTVDGSVTDASSSMGIGLIVTELVINALKHGFPSHRKGEIKVDFRSSGSGWTLRVADDGVGMPKDAASAKSGLGTSIIQALARNLNATVEITDADPGMVVAVVNPGSQPSTPS